MQPLHDSMVSDKPALLSRTAVLLFETYTFAHFGKLHVLLAMSGLCLVALVPCEISSTFRSPHLRVHVSHGKISPSELDSWPSHLCRRPPRFLQPRDLTTNSSELPASILPSLDLLSPTPVNSARTSPLPLDLKLLSSTANFGSLSFSNNFSSQSLY